MKPYCTICGGHFLNSSALRAHVEREHPETTYTVNLTERLEPYGIVTDYEVKPDNVTYGPETNLRSELLETNLRYIAAVLAADRVPAVTRAEVGKRIERCLELLR